LKVSINFNIAMQCFENFGGNLHPPWLRQTQPWINPPDQCSLEKDAAASKKITSVSEAAARNCCDLSQSIFARLTELNYTSPRVNWTLMTWPRHVLKVISTRHTGCNKQPQIPLSLIYSKNTVTSVSSDPTLRYAAHENQHFHDDFITVIAIVQRKTSRKVKSRFTTTPSKPHMSVGDAQHENHDGRLEMAARVMKRSF